MPTEDANVLDGSISDVAEPPKAMVYESGDTLNQKADDETTRNGMKEEPNDYPEEPTAEHPVDSTSPTKQTERNDTTGEETASAPLNGSFKHTESTVTRHNTKQYEYIKRGSRIKALLSTAFRAVADEFIANVETTGGNKKRDCREVKEEDDVGGKKKARGDRLVHAEDLARERTRECVDLKRKIQELESQIQALQQENYASHQTSTQLQSKIDRTVAALQIASTSSANARAEADAAEARANSLSRQVNEFHSLVEELRRGMEAIRGEHDEVSTAARSVEGRLIQVESELGRATKVKIEAEEERDGLKARAECAEQKARVLAEKVEDYEHEIRCLKKDVVEMAELEKIRSERTHRIENELHGARGTLLEATSAAAEAESTVTSLNSVIEELRKENELLHNQINESRDVVHKERNKQNEALTVAEKEVQKWKLRCEEEQEANRSLKLDKSSAEKQLEQMKSRMAHLERRANEHGGDSTRFDPPVSSGSTAVTPMTSSLGLINSFGAKNSSLDSEPRKELTYVSKLPMREKPNPSAHDTASRELSYSSSKYFSSDKENYTQGSSRSQSTSHETPSFVKRKVTKSNICCICQQAPVGMMKNCQCDKINCDKRAHMTCIARMNSDKGGLSSAVLCE